jgi:hypothetical protein
MLETLPPTPTFSEVYELLRRRGPGRTESTRGTVYRIEARGGNIVAIPNSSRITVHEDCWTQVKTCQGTRAGGIYNGPYSILTGMQRIDDSRSGRKGRERLSRAGEC